MNQNFTCPYCNQPTTITDPNSFYNLTHINISKSTFGDVCVVTRAITCPNNNCNKLWLDYSLYTHEFSYGKSVTKELIQSWQLLPESNAKSLPNYIPDAIKEDYYEACRIQNLSPKASATLSRRCLQGMIRDFWHITKPRLIDEINELEARLDPLVWESIDSVRKVGNIGAHMEKDINIIIDVLPEEAGLLIGLIEQLIEDWYIDRHNKEERLNKIKELAKNKEDKKQEQ